MSRVFLIPMSIQKQVPPGSMALTLWQGGQRTAASDTFYLLHKTQKILTGPVQITATIVIPRILIFFHELIRKGKTDAPCDHLSFQNEKRNNLY